MTDSSIVVDTQDCPARQLGLTPDLSPPPRRSRSSSARRRNRWMQLTCLGVLPLIAMLLGLASAYFKYQEVISSEALMSGGQATTAAVEIATAMLSYTPAEAEAELTAVREQLTGPFRESYTTLTNDVVIPGAQQGQVSAVARIPGAAVLGATPTSASVLLFVDQTVTLGTNPPTQTASVVRVAMERVGSRWLVSGFEPI